MDKSTQRRILPNPGPSNLQPLFPKPVPKKPLALIKLVASASANPAAHPLLSIQPQPMVSIPRQRRLITDQEMLATSSPPNCYKARRVNFTQKEVDVLLQAVRAHREHVLYGVAGGKEWSFAWGNIAAIVTKADKIHRSESDVRKKWTYLKWEAKNTSKPGRDATSRAVAEIIKTQDEDGYVSARDLYEDVTHLQVPLQVGKVAAALPTMPTAASAGPRRVPKPLAPKPTSPLPPPPPPEVCLRWNSYHSNMQATFPALLTSQRYVDVTLACEGRSIQCHKMMLSACSTFFDELLSQNPCQHPIVLMKDLKFWEIQALVDFMYRGEVNVSQDKLPSLLAAAEALQIKGLAGPASVPGPSSHDEPDDSAAPQLEHFAEGDVAGNVLAAAAAAADQVGPSQARRVRRRRVQQVQQPPKFLVAATSGGQQQQRSLLAPARKRKIDPLPQPMRIKLEPTDNPQSDDDAEDRFTIDTSAADNENDGNTLDIDPGPPLNNAQNAESDNLYDYDANPLLPEVVMAPDQASN